MAYNEMDIALETVRPQVINISRMLPTGAKFYTVEATDIDQGFEERKNQIMADPNSPEFIQNRSPRVVTLKDHSVLSQDFEIDMNGNKVVVFNKGTGDEAQATIIAGGTTFAQTTDEAMKDALRGQTRIFADGVKTATKVNMLNNAELARVEQQIKYWTGKADALKSAIAANTKKVQEYQEALAKFKKMVDLSAGEGPVSVTVEA